MAADDKTDILLQYRRRRTLTRQGQTALIFGTLASVILLPSAILLFFGMLPTLVVYFFIERKKKKSMTVTVGAMNLAGVAPFLISLWDGGHQPDQAMQILTSPLSIVTMYMAAAVGYLVNWAVTGLVTSILSERGRYRVKEIKKQQEKLIERWGQKVTGEVKLDRYGFPVQDDSSKDS